MAGLVWGWLQVDVPMVDEAGSCDRLSAGRACPAMRLGPGVQRVLDAWSRLARIADAWRRGITEDSVSYNLST
jgi:hypothetical protein